MFDTFISCKHMDKSPMFDKKSCKDRTSLQYLTVLIARKNYDFQ